MLASLNRRVGHPDVPDPCPQLTVENVISGNASIILTHAGDSSMCQYLTVGDALTLDTEDASEASQMERVQAVYLVIQLSLP